MWYITGMRTALLLMLFSFSSSAELEQITTTDGRTLVGVYDEDKQSLHMLVGKIESQIPLKPAQIATRKPVKAPMPERNFIEEAKLLSQQEKAIEERRAREKAAAQEAERVAAIERAREAAERIRRVAAVEESIKAARMLEKEERATRERIDAEQKRKAAEQEEADRKFQEEDRRAIARREAEQARKKVEPILDAMSEKIPNEELMANIHMMQKDPQKADQLVATIKALNRGEVLSVVRAARPNISAMWCLIKIEAPDYWGDRTQGRRSVLPLRMTDLNGTDGGFAFVDKESKLGTDLLEYLKDGNRRLLLLALTFQHEDPDILHAYVLPSLP